MIQAKKQLDRENLHKVLRGMLIRMRNNAMGQFDHIGPRALIELQDIDLFDKPTAPIGLDLDLEVLRDHNHPLRLELPPGLLLFCLSKDEKPKRILVNVPTLLYSELLEIRKAAFSYLNELIVDEKIEVTPKTLGVLKSSQAGILSDISHKWRTTAIALNDAFNDDILVALQGVKQCLECRSTLQESLNSYVPRMMYPAVSSLDSIILEVRTPEKEHPKMMEIVSSIVGSAATLHDACEDYYLRLGYIPLASPYSMGDVVDCWMASHSNEDAWSVIWNWAHSSFGPIPQYHACSVFILYPKLVPEGKLPDLWREILNVVIGSESKDSKNTEQSLWGLRHDLIRHFTCHLEAHLPDNDSDSIVCFAWWLAERVAKIFSDETESAQFYRKNWVEPALDKSTHIWLAASPHIGSSSLRYATATVPFPWVMAFLALMGRNLEKLSPEKQDTELQTKFQSILISCLISTLPVVEELPADPTYAVEYPLGETALKWAAHQREELRNALEQLVSTSRTLGLADGLVTALRNLTDYSIADQAAVVLILKSLVYKNQLDAISVWDIFENMEWRQKVLNSIEDRVLWILIEVLSALQVRDQEKWIFLLPHYLAEVCEKSENLKRQRQLFMYVLHTSLISDTVSAVHRLLRGSQKSKFAQFAKEYCALVENMWSYYPAWVQGRLRGLLASLRVV